MSTIDNNNYETYISYTGEAEEIKKFKESVIDRGFFSFPAILPVPVELTEHPMIENACYTALMLNALRLDPKIKYYGNIREKKSKDTFYKEIIIPYEASGISYKSYTEKEIINIAFRDEMATEREKHTIEEAISVLIEKSDAIMAEEVYQRMKKYGCATRYSWRQRNWGAPMEATGCQVRPEEAKVAPYADDAIMVYTSGGNGLAILQFMAKKFSKIYFQFIWRRIDEEGKVPDGVNQKGGYEEWTNGRLTREEVYEYHVKSPGTRTEAELDSLMDAVKKTFRKGWEKA